MVKKAALVGLTLSSLVLTGCLRKEATHTLYLSPDGSVRWTAVESQVYSDEEDAGKRFAEEQAYIGPALIGGHTMAGGLRAMGPLGLVETTVVRDQRPFHVITQARFDRIDLLMGRTLRELGVKARTDLSSADGVSRLSIMLDFSRDLEDKDTPVGRMLQDVTDLRITLVDGRFLDSPDFELGDHVQARISDAWLTQAQEAMDARRPIHLRLTWRD
jgi:hypothetical protein